MSLEDKLTTSGLGLKGLTPTRRRGTDISSTTHAVDPTPGKQGDESISFDSAFDLDGKTPNKLPSSLNSSDTHIDSFDSSVHDLDGKTPDILPSAVRSSATHVYDPDFSINQINDPLLSLKGKELKIAQDSRRSNNTVTFQSAFAPPQSQTKRKYYTTATMGDALGGGSESNFSSDRPITRD